MHLTTAGARDLRSAREIFADHQAVRARLWSLKKQPEPVPVPAPVVAAPPESERPAALPVLESPAWLDNLIELNETLRALTGTFDAPALPDEAPKPTRSLMRIVRATVAEHYGMTLLDIDGPSRRALLVLPRHVAMYLCRRVAGKTTSEIARTFGNRNHATALHAIRRIARLCGDDPGFAADVALVTTKIHESRA